MSAPSSGGGAVPAAAAGAPQAVVTASGGQGPAEEAAGASAGASAAPRALLGSGPCLSTPKEQSIHNRIEGGSPGIRIAIGSDRDLIRIGSARLGLGSESDRIGA